MARNPNILHAVRALFSINRPLRVLIVEDYVDLARMMTLLLGHCGFQVRTLNEGSNVLETARSFRPHFILLDLSLPVINGFEVAAMIRADATLQNVKIIAVSGSSVETHATRLQHSGIDHYLRKPVELEDFLGLVVPSLLA